MFPVDSAASIHTHAIALAGARVDTGLPRIAGPETDTLFTQYRADTGTLLKFAPGGNRIVGLIQLTAEGGIKTPTLEAYRQLLEATKGHHLCRIWNFVPRINEVDTSGLETYQAFCQARADAFGAHFGPDHQGLLSAASAVGSDCNVLTVLFTADKAKPRHVENPLQVSAYAYPPRYGPRPPSFSRATISQGTNGRGDLFISGTAAIRGHETMFHGDLQGQLGCTLENLESIGRAAGLRTGLKDARCESKQLRVYLRHASDYPAVKARLDSDVTRPADTVFFLRSDICRSDLLLEIEVTLLNVELDAPA